jgi:hypothetical protein
MNKIKSVFSNFSNKTVILYKLYYTPYILKSVPFHKEYGIKYIGSVSFNVIQVTFILIGMLYYWALLYVFVCMFLSW